MEDRDYLDQKLRPVLVELSKHTLDNKPVNAVN